jgi:hypothetical protein
MKDKRIYVGAAAVAVVLAVGGWLLWGGGANNENFPEGTLWMCTNPACGNTFTLTMKQLGEHHKAHFGQLPPCPKCGRDAIGAHKCEHCGKVYVEQRGSSICPFCFKPQSPPKD